MTDIKRPAIRVSGGDIKFVCKIRDRHLQVLQLNVKTKRKNVKKKKNLSL